ncbi:unnamed protein product [Musa textilis]
MTPPSPPSSPALLLDDGHGLHMTLTWSRQRRHTPQEQDSKGRLVTHVDGLRGRLLLLRTIENMVLKSLHA